jgi:hypothetical protein
MGILIKVILTPFLPVHPDEAKNDLVQSASLR